MIADKNAKYAGFASIAQGVDSANAPSTLPSNQLAWLRNGTTRGGYPTCRPGMRRMTLQYMKEDGTIDTTVQDNFETGGLWQGAGAYLADNGYGYLCCSIGGHIFRIRLTDYAVTDLTASLGNGAGDYNHPTKPLTWWAQAENLQFIQNASDKPFIYNGSTLRRAVPVANGGTELPTGSAMEYNKGRLWVASPDGTSFVAGDLAYSVSGNPEDVKGFTENTFLNGGGAFIVPAAAGRITAMRSVAVQDTSTGQGPLMVCTNKGAFSVDAPFERTDWQNTTNPIETTALLSSGPASQNATVNVNGDVWFRSLDGVRSLAVARREQGSWTNTPLSREVERVLNYDTPALLDYGSAALFDNRLLTTTGPQLFCNSDRELRGITHSGLAVLDFSPVSQMFNRGTPHWDGVWTGLDILQIISLEDRSRTRCFIFAVSPSTYKIELWELSTDDRFDFCGDDCNPIEWVIETPSYGYEDGGWSLKKLAYGDLWLSRLMSKDSLSSTSIIAYFRCDNDPTWQAWSVTQQCALPNVCDYSTGCALPGSYSEQYRPRLRLPAPAETCETTTGKPVNYGYRFAAKLLIQGFCSVNQLRLIAREQSEAAEGACPDAVCASVPSLANPCAQDYGYRADNALGIGGDVLADELGEPIVTEGSDFIEA